MARVVLSSDFAKQNQLEYSKSVFSMKKYALCKGWQAENITTPACSNEKWMNNH